MNYKCTKPCNECPFHVKNKGYKMLRLIQFALSPFHCHKTGDLTEEEYDEEGNEVDAGNEFVPNENSSYCAGAIIFLAKRPKQFNDGITPPEVKQKLMKHKNLVK